MPTVKNEKSNPKRFFGLHFKSGVAQYNDNPSEGAYLAFIDEPCMKQMDETAEGCPFYVEHVDAVDMDNLKETADGFAIRSFYNPPDGCHWVEFQVFDEGQAAIAKGWTISNCYTSSVGPGGKWHDIEYKKEYVSGKYEHFALVPNPRYEESIILTPEEFKKYNEEKMAELERHTNSSETEKGEESPMFDIFKKEKVKNEAELATLSVVLPKSKREVTITRLVNEADEADMKKAEDEKKNAEGVTADPSHKVKIHDGSEMTVEELLEKHKNLCDELESVKKNAEEKPEEGEVKEEEKKEDAVPPGEDEGVKEKALEIAEHEEKEMEEAKKKNAKEKADRVRNAGPKVEVVIVETTQDQAARGRTLYGNK